MDPNRPDSHLDDMFRNRIALLLVTTLSLQASRLAPTMRRPHPWRLACPAAIRRPHRPANRAIIQAWWTNFNDPELSSIVERARAGNLDIAQAVARLRQAHESLIQSRADLLPTVSGSAGYNRALLDNIGARDNFSLGANVAYQADLFGGVRRGIEASRAAYAGERLRSRHGADLDRRRGRAQLYPRARWRRRNLAIARDTLAIQDDNLQIAGWRRAGRAGLVARRRAGARRSAPRPPRRSPRSSKVTRAPSTGSAC